MTSYSICYLDAQGRTLSTEFLPFDNDKAATAFARVGIARHPIVEVWVSGDLVDRLSQEGSRAGAAEGAQDRTAAAVRADRHKAVDDWNNESGLAHAMPSDGVHR